MVMNTTYKVHQLRGERFEPFAFDPSDPSVLRESETTQKSAGIKKRCILRRIGNDLFALG